MNNSFEITACPICSKQDFELFLTVPDHLLSKEEFKLHKCKACSFVFTANAPLETSAGKYYDTEDYIEHSDDATGIINRLYHFSRKYMLKYKLRLLKKHRIKEGLLLDIGSASGYFLNFMKQSGFDARGVEISEKARQLCKDNFDIDAETPDDWLSAESKANYSAITMWHVMEHVYPIGRYLDKIHSNLSDTGRAFIAMPNHKSFDAKYYQSAWAAYDVPRHLWHFSSKTFKLIAEKHGFELVKIHNLPLDPFYISLVSSDYSINKGLSKLGAPFVGILSSIFSWVNKEKSSSLVYVLKKAKA